MISCVKHVVQRPLCLAISGFLRYDILKKGCVSMAKKMYKIPYGLNSSYGDMEIAFQTKEGIGSKPLPVKVIISYLFSAMMCFFMVAKSFVRFGSILQIILFVVLWVALTFVLLSYDATRRMQIELVATLINYIPRGAREIITRMSSSALPFYRIAGIKSISKKNGVVEYVDGTYGYWYRVVGSASILLFDKDKQMILDRVDNFYRKMNTDAEIVFMTTKSSQQVYKQIASLKRKYDSLASDDPDLKNLANEQFRTLRDYVGSSFKCIHQYMVIKADNKEMLLQTKNIVQSEVENSSLMIKRCVPMYYDDIVATLELVYRGKGR